MSVSPLSVLLSAVWLCQAQNLVCQKEVWLPSNSTPPLDPNCEAYDGSLVPNCKYFLNNVTSYYHVHEYGESVVMVVVMSEWDLNDFRLQQILGVWTLWPLSLPVWRM